MMRQLTSGVVGRSRGPMRMLRWFLVGALLLAVLSTCGGCGRSADNDEPPARPTACNSVIRYDVHGGVYAPDGAVAAQDAVFWAYRQVSGSTSTQPVRTSDDDVRWVWQSDKSGGEYEPGTADWDRGVMSDRLYFVHAMDGDASPTQVELRQQILRGVVRDFGVKRPTSTGEGLSAGDRTALERICNTKAGASKATAPAFDKADGVSETPSPAEGEDGTASQNAKPGKDSETEDATDTEKDAAPARPELVQRYGKFVIAGLILAALLYIGMSLLRGRVKDGSATRRGIRETDPDVGDSEVEDR